MNSTQSILYDNTNKIDDLFFAVYHGDFIKTKKLIEDGADINNIDKEGNSLLRTAISSDSAYEDKKNVINLLLDEGADINNKNKNGQTALHIAISNKDKDTAKLLLERGADVNIQDVDGNSVLHIAALKNYIIVFNKQFSNGMIISSRSSGSEFSNESQSIFKLLLNNGANKDAMNSKGETALDIATAERNSQIIRLLSKNKTWFLGGVITSVAQEIGGVRNIILSIAAPIYANIVKPTTNLVLNVTKNLLGYNGVVLPKEAKGMIIQTVKSTAFVQFAYVSLVAIYSLIKNAHENTFTNCMKETAKDTACAAGEYAAATIGSMAGVLAASVVTTSAAAVALPIVGAFTASYLASKACGYIRKNIAK